MKISKFLLVMYSPTFNLARVKGFVETLQVSSNNEIHKEKSLNYLIIIDFESTCWDEEEERYGKYPEIIEFPAVLLDLQTGEILAEFRHFVLPVENPLLSPFCTKFTGITQADVEGGIALKTCMLLFKQWVDRIVEPSWSFSLCTWSDWDLGTCLSNECKRKVIPKPDLFNKWIDLRACYKAHYKRKPNGLRLSMNELGLAFEGREHSGIWDARNTAQLAWRLKQDGFQFQMANDLPINS